MEDADGRVFFFFSPLLFLSRRSRIEERVGEEEREYPLFLLIYFRFTPARNEEMRKYIYIY